MERILGSSPTTTIFFTERPKPRMATWGGLMMGVDQSMGNIPTLDTVNVPLDYSALSMGELYYQLGEKEKAEAIFTGIADNAMRSVNWYFRLKPGQLSSVESDLGHNLAVVQEVLRINKQYNPTFCEKYQEEFDNYRMAYGSVAKE